ncbi:mis18-binding protein 1 isoform X2 [Gouania willdenowi]|uniref:mis18-binding protein 1 isoform X2 n=1 Tax=Gouania willdenowi TaxID=441366 RepID=UPI00105450B3|nr:mis18-binding protein 1 isoform X2 [Gouania willdenowi]
MASQHYLLKQTTQQFSSPSKVFARLKSKVQRGETCVVEAAEKPGADFSSPRKHNGNAWMSEELWDNQRVGSYYTEVEPLTLSPISSPQKRCRYSDKTVLDVSLGTGGGQTHTGRGLLESTALSQPSSWVNTIQTRKDPPQIRDMSSRTPVKTQMTDRDRDRSVFVDQPDNVFSPIRSRLRKRKHNPPAFYRAFGMTGWETKERKSSAPSGNDSYYKSSVMDPVKQLPVDQSKVTNEPMIPLSKAILKRCTVSVEKCPQMSPAKVFAFMKEKETNLPKNLHNIKRNLNGKSHQVGDAHLSSSLAVNVSQVSPDSDAPDSRTNTIACKSSVHSRSSGYSSEDVLLSHPPADGCANDEVFTHKTMLNDDSEKHQAGFNPGDMRPLESQERVSHQNEGQASLTSRPQKLNQIEIPPTSEEEIQPLRRGKGTASLELTAMSQPLGIKDLKSLKVSSRMSKNDNHFFEESPPLSKHSSEADIFSPIKSRLRSRNWQLNDYSKRGESRNENCSWLKERKLSALRDDHSNKTSIQGAGDVVELPVNQSEVIPEHRVPQLGTNVEKCFSESGFPLRSPAKMFSYMKERENKRKPQTHHHIRRETFSECKVPPSRDVPVLPVQTEADREDVTVTSANQSINGPALIQSASSSLDEVVPVPAAQPKPVLFEDPLVLNSPRIFIPKKPEAVFKRNKWPKQVQFPNESVIYLKKWFLRKNGMGLFVEGIHREENISWNSSNIKDRVSSSVLKTVSGRVYILDGKMNMDRASDFPRWILIKFAKGFPSNWKDLYEKLLLESRVKQRRCSDGGKTVKTPAANAVNISVRQSQKRSFKTPEPCSPPSSASQLNMSRSGRVIKAPLEYWKGGRVMLDAHMNVTIHKGYETSMCNPDTSSIGSSSVLQANVHVLLPNTADSREKKATGGKEESVPTRKVKALIHPQSRSNVGIAEKVSKPVEQQVEAPHRTKETSGRATRSNKQSPTAEKQTHVETVPRKERNAPGKQKAKKQQQPDTDRTTAGASGTKQAKINAVDPQEQDEEKWTGAELKKLKEAVSYYPKHILGYWERVSQMVGTRSAEECCNQHAAPETSQTAAKEAKKVQKKKKKKMVVAPKDPELPVISARAGTLKRKQQVRQYLDTMPRDNVDDVFSSAYMQNKRMPFLCPSEDHDLSISDMEPVTPKSNGYPQVKTPQCLYITPGMMGSPNRSIDDKCVYQLQKRMKKNRFNVNKYSATAKFPTTPSVRQTMKRCSNAEDTSFVVWEMFPGNDAAQSDSGEEEDVYFSEND